MEKLRGANAWSDPSEPGRRILELVFCSFVALWLMADAYRRDAFATDFHYAFWPAARHVLEGVTPYPHIVDFGRLPFVYPAPAAVLLTPFGLLPHAAADVLFTLVVATAGVFTLRLCRVRDWRCYGIAFLWAPVFSAVQTANLTLLLALGLAVLWRVRDRTLAAAAVAALLVAVKLFLWPVIVWLAIWRGVRSAAWAVVIAVLITATSWAVIGFHGLTAYPDLVRLVDRLEAPHSYSLVALGLKLEFGMAAATAAAILAGAAVLVVAGRVARTEPDGRRSFALAVAAILLSSPVVWLHYFALLLVPVALLRPRFGPLWLVPLLLWPCPVMISTTTWWPLAPLAVFGGVITVAMLHAPSFRRRELSSAPVPL